MIILIVDDNESMRRVMRALVCGLASEVHECSDGSEAQAAYAAHRPDWVLMDVRMRVVDGITATDLLTSAFPEARVLIVTDYDDEDLMEAGRRAGALGYLIKDNLLDLTRVLQAPAQN